MKAEGRAEPPLPPEAPWTRSPVLIWGMQKTGSSLLLSLIDGHPDLLCFPDELRIKYYFNRFPWPGEAELRADYRQQIWKGRATSGLLKAAFGLEAPGDPRIGGLTVAEAGERLDIERYGCELARRLSVPVTSAAELLTRDAMSLRAALREPGVEPRAWAFKMVGGDPGVGDTFLTAFLHGKIIYIVRDPRGGLSSRLKDWERKKIAPQLGAMRVYLDKYAAHYAAVRSLRGRYHESRLLVVRYEDLVRDVAKEMQRVFAFLGLAPHAGAHEPTTLGRSAQVWNATESDRGIFVTSAEDWRTRLSRAELILAERHCRDIFRERRFGYKPSLPEWRLKLAEFCASAEKKTHAAGADSRDT